MVPTKDAPILPACRILIGVVVFRMDTRGLRWAGPVLLLLCVLGVFLALPAAEGERAQQLNQQGLELLKQGRLEQAVGVFRQALALEPDYPDALNNLATALRAQGDLEGAIATYKKALAVRPAFPAALHNLGVALALNGQFEEAVAAFDNALEIEPNFPEALYQLGNALAARGQLDHAISAYRRALALDDAGPLKPELHYNLALALHALGREQEAEREFASAQQLNPLLTPPRWEREQAGRSGASAPARFAVQLAAYEERERAEALARRLSRTYPEVLVAPTEAKGKTFYRVRIPAGSEAEARALAARLRREEKLKPWVVPLE